MTTDPIDETARLLRYFRFEHLPEQLQAASRPFCILARQLAADIDFGHVADPTETVEAIRLLLKAKDAAVRAHVPTTT